MKFQKHRQYDVADWKDGSIKTWTASIYIGGDIDVARQKIRELCFPKGLCATLIPTEYIYAGGEEKGFVIGMIQYPPFPETEKSLENKAVKVGKEIAKVCFQWSFSVVMPSKTLYFSRRQRTA